MGFLFAGPAFIWAWPFVFAGQMMVALQFAELAAHYPIAGSVYQWSKKIAGKAWAWNNGWVYLCAQIVTIPAVAVGWQIILPQISDGLPDHQVLARRVRHLSGRELPDVPRLGVRARTACLLGAIMILMTTTINIAGVRVSWPRSTTSAWWPSWSAPPG